MCFEQFLFTVLSLAVATDIDAAFDAVVLCILPLASVGTHLTLLQLNVRQHRHLPSAVRPAYLHVLCVVYFWDACRGNFGWFPTGGTQNRQFHLLSMLTLVSFEVEVKTIITEDVLTVQYFGFAESFDTQQAVEQLLHIRVGHDAGAAD